MVLALAACIVTKNFVSGFPAAGYLDILYLHKTPLGFFGILYKSTDFLVGSSEGLAWTPTPPTLRKIVKQGPLGFYSVDKEKFIHEKFDLHVTLD